MNKRIWIVCFALMILCTTSVYGLVVRSGDNIKIKVDEVIDDDLVAFGQNVSIKGKVNGDIYAFGQEVEVTGDVAGTIFCGASTVDIDAQIAGSVWAGAGKVSIAGNVYNNVLIFGGTLDVEEDATIGNDLIVYGGKAKVAGEVDGMIKGGMGTFIMSGKSAKVNINADKIRIKSGALISGDLVIESGQEPVIEEGAEILGEIKLKSIEEVDEEVAFAIVPIIAFLIIMFKVIVFVAKIIVGIVLIVLSKKYVRRIMDTVISKPWHCLGWGFIGLIVIPVAVIILFSILIGYPFAVFGAYVYTFIFYLASIFAGLVIGEKVIRLFKKEGEISLYLSLIIGLIVLFVLGLIPILGFIVKIIVLLFGSGMVLYGSWNLIREMKAKELI